VVSFIQKKTFIIIIINAKNFNDRQKLSIMVSKCLMVQLLMRSQPLNVVDMIVYYLFLKRGPIILFLKSTSLLEKIHIIFTYLTLLQLYEVPPYEKRNVL